MSHTRMWLIGYKVTINTCSTQSSTYPAHRTRAKTLHRTRAKTLHRTRAKTLHQHAPRKDVETHMHTYTSLTASCSNSQNRGAHVPVTDWSARPSSPRPPQASAACVHARERQPTHLLRDNSEEGTPLPRLRLRVAGAPLQGNRAVSCCLRRRGIRRCGSGRLVERCSCCRYQRTLLR
jgi:hypothetical protein